MEAPVAKLSQEGFDQAIKTHVENHYREENGTWRCKVCGVVIKQATCYASLHSKEFANICAGFGQVSRVPLPYCPKCEGEPKNVYTCIHC